MLEHVSFPIHITMFCIVLLRIDLRQEISVEYGKNLIPNDDKYKQNTLMADSLHNNYAGHCSPTEIHLT
jgi:hypothetical protein